MTTATLEQTQTAELPPAVHQFDETGICQNPDVIKVTLPKGCVCELRLAADAGGAWHIGYHLAAGKEGATDTFPQIGGPLRHSRETALQAALVDAINFFEASPKSKLHKKCAGLVHAFMIGGENAIPAAGAPKAKLGPLPEPQNLDLPVARLEENPHNPRGETAKADVEELAETIKSQGLLQPIGVRIIVAEGGLPGIGEDNRLELLWGHRRLAAFRSLKRETIPCRVYAGISDEQARLVISIENDERQDLDPIQRARGYAQMMTDFELTQDDVAGALKKSRPVIANALRLLELPADVQELLGDGKLTSSHGVALLRFKDWPPICSHMATLAVKEKTSANDLEKGIPFDSDLNSRGMIVRAGWQWEPTAAQRKDPDYRKDGYNWYCFNPAKFKEDQKARAAKTREENKAKAEKSGKTKIAKKDYIATDKDVVVEKELEHLVELVPDSQRTVGRRSSWDSDRREIIHDKKLWNDIVARRQAIIAADGEKKLAPVFKEAWKHIETLKKLDGWTVALLCATSVALDPKEFSGEVAKRLKLDLAKHAKNVFIKNKWNDFVLKLNAFASCDPLEVVKLVAGQWIVTLEQDFAEDGHLNDSNLAWLGFLAGSRDAAEFELITEKEIVAQLRGEFPFTEEPAAPAKAKKGGKKK